MECIFGIFVAMFGGVMVLLGILNFENIFENNNFLIPLLGVVFMLVGIYVFVSTKHKFIERRRFKKHGLIIDAEIVKIEQKMNWLYNGKHPYVIYCQWTNPLDGKTYNYRTGKFLNNPEEYIQGITTLEVKIHPENPYMYKLNDDMFKNIRGYSSDR